LGEFFATVGDELSLYVRHAAWLHTAPKPKTPAKRGMSAAQDEPRSRAQRITEAGGHPEMPPTGPESHLLGILFDVGPVMPGGMAAVPITDADLIAWQHNSGIRLSPWQARTLRRLSRDYAAEQRRAEDPDAPPPYSTAPAYDRDVVGKQVANAFKALALAQKGKR